MFYALLKWLVRIAVNIYYKKIEIHNLDKIPQDGPVIILSNHPNTLMDPLLIALLCQRQVHFLANASLFRKPLHNWIMSKWLNMIPIFRKQDLRNVSDLDENKAIFQRCFDFLAQNGVLLIFPEGTSFSERRLRPIKTGAARIALGTLSEKKIAPKISLVGLNYSNPLAFRSNIFINIGQSIDISNFIEIYEQKANRAIVSLSRQIESELAKLIINTKNPEEEGFIRILESILQKEKDSEQQKFLQTQQIIQVWRYLEEQNPEKSQILKKNLLNYQQQLNTHRLQSHQIESSFRIDSTDLIPILLAPLGILGVFFHYLPYKIPDTVARRLTPDVEFHAPIRMVVGLLSFTIFYIFWAFCFFFVANPTYISIFLLILPLLAYLALALKQSVEKLEALQKREKAKKNGVLTLIVEQKKQIIDFWQQAQQIWEKQKQ